MNYDIETKAQWMRSEEPSLKKAHQVWSNVKVLLTVLFDCNGVVHHKFLPQEVHKVVRSIINTTLKLCADCAEQFVGNPQNC